MHAPTASAELHDASESYQANTVRLNQQLAEMSLQLSESRKAETRLAGELEAARAAQEEQAERADSLEASLGRVNQEVASSTARVLALQQEAEQRECAVREATLVQLKLEEVLVEKGQWEGERERWEEEKECLTAQLARLAGETAVSECPLAASPRLAPWEDERASLIGEVQLLRREKSRLVADLERERSQLSVRMAALAKEVEEARSDGVAESEILQSRISELVQEASEVEKKMKDTLECEG